MKKGLLITAGIVGVLILLFYLVVVPQFVGMITHYDRFTFEYVTESEERLADFGIYEKRNPADYGFPSYETVDFRSLQDDLNLNGWFIPASAPSVNKTLIIAHGRTSNRLKTLKYLELIKDKGLDSLYHILIPDLRNSGKSDVSSTALGYEFAEDIVGSMQFLNQEYGQTEFALWGFSMGAMGSAIAVNRPDLVAFQQEKGLKVSQLILASPLANAFETSRLAAADMGIPDFMFKEAWKSFDDEVNDYSEFMRFSHLLKNTSVPALLLFSDGDKTTPSHILDAEIEGMMHVYPVLFKDADHVQIYTRKIYKERYADRVNQFLRME